MNFAKSIRSYWGQLATILRFRTAVLGEYVPVLSRKLKRFSLVIACISLLGLLGSWFLQITQTDITRRAWPVEEIAHAARSRLAGITTELDSMRDWTAEDMQVQYALGASSRERLFPLMHQHDSSSLIRIPDSILFNGRTDARKVSDRGIAAYTPTGKLLAWYTSRPVTIGFDSVLSGDFLLATRDRGVFFQSIPLSSHLLSIRKIVTKDSRILGYIVTKWVLSTGDALSSQPRTSFLDDIAEVSHRSVTLRFGGTPSLTHSDASTIRLDLYADPADPSSFVGSLGIGALPAPDPSSLSRVLNAVWRVGFTILLISLLFWVVSGASSVPQTKHPLLTRLLFSVVSMVVIGLVRIVLAQFHGLTLLIPQSFHNPNDFTSDWGFSVAQNPFELFITSLVATVAAALLWIIWMPRQRLVRDDSNKKDILEIVRSEAGMLILFSLTAIFGSQLLLDGLSQAVGSIVSGSGLQYLIVNQVLPSPAMFTMLLALLGFGVTYLFLSSLLLTFSLRAVIYILPRTISLKLRVLLGSALVAMLTIVSTGLLSASGVSDTDINFRFAMAAAMFAISLAIILIDAFAKQPIADSASFLYRIPRSSRSILFILAGSAMIMSPLIAQKQLRTDKEVAERIVQKNAEADAAELQRVSERALSTAKEQLRQWSVARPTSSNLQQLAYLVWLRTMSEHPDWNAAIDLTDEGGGVVSHFATSAGRSELPRLRPIYDSTLRELHNVSMIDQRVTKIIDGFSGTATPAILAGLRCSTNPGMRYYITVILWSELPALIARHASADLLGGRVAQESADDPLANGGFIVAEYRPNARRLTNTPSLDVPATIPFWYDYRLKHEQSFWHSSRIGGGRYQTLYYRVPVIGKQTEPSIMTISIPEPSFARTMEFALRLNAIGLLYGSLIALVLLMIRQATTRRFRYTLRFRDRIFLIVLLIALVPLVVVTNVTRTLLGDRAHADEEDRLARDASVIKDRIARKMELGYVNLFGPDLQNEVDDLSQIIGRDFSIYDGNGLLRAASKPELYESSLLSSTLSSNAVEEVVLGKKSFYSEPLTLGSESYQIGYQPITSTTPNQMMAVVSLTTLDEQSRIEAEIARTTSFIYGTFAALGLVLLGIGALFAARVASPILALIEATKRVAKGKLGTSIPVNREDEIGELMHAFNTMTYELEKSREIVAQNERELAWKEMARQVAHEIKNPLTPMKLSVQHIEHAHDAKDPNFNSIFRRVIKTLSEQIDVLTRIATEFSRFGEMPRRKWGPVSLRKVAESAVALFDSERSRIRFIIDVPSELSNVHADEQELRRAFVNIIRNAVQAMEGWGVIVIRANQDRGMLHLRLTDTGIGMSDETLQRVFDPNFSTKTSGMGLGLAIVKKTITDMSGAIRVESTLGHGTTFFIDLPAREYIDEADEGESDI